MFPDEIFEDIEKKDGVIALAFFAIIFILMFVFLYLIKILPLFFIMKTNENFAYKLIFAIIMDLPGFVGIIAILKLRQQKISTVGLRRYGLKSSLYVGIILISTFFIYYISKKGFNLNLIWRTIDFIIFVGFYEELIFRGFLWPRLVVGFGKTWGTILSGIFFGMAHLPINIVFNNKSVFQTFILGNGSNVNIGGGLIGALWFIFIYTRNSNILLPSFVHGIQDMMSMI
ncbi:CAAX amino terminal protease family protein [Clostridiales bacterium oral taxon 876 str. F0540]|nr:CAAX amino terminal protease family protein [Clostridiales bacterium oral taxon 876 str. F0540]